MPATPQEKAAGLIVLRLGSNMSPPRRADEDAEAVARLLDRYPFGGLILFNGAWPATTETLRDLQRRSAAGLLVCTDMERGLGQQVAGATVFPHQRALAEAGEGAVSTFARMAAEEALAFGVHVALAPLADVNRNPENPIISTRAFGEDTQKVERLVRTYVHSARSAGILTTAKHFPGHGNTREDSHAVTPVVPDAFEELARLDLPPFRAAIEAGVDLVMTAHVAYPALDETSRPATRSRPILQDLLRDWLGFDGVVISDSLHMGGILDDSDGEVNLAVDMLNAGVDLLLDLQDPKVCVEGLARAVEEGRLAEATLDRSLRRVDALRSRLRARFGENVFHVPQATYPADGIGCGRHRRHALTMAREAVLLLDGSLPDLGTGKGLGVVLLDASASPQPASALEEALSQKLPDATFVASEPNSASAQSVVRTVRAAERILVVVVLSPRAWLDFGLSHEQQTLVAELVGQRPCILAALGDPRALETFEGAEARLCTYSDAPVSCAALIDFIAPTR